MTENLKTFKKIRLFIWSVNYFVEWTEASFQAFKLNKTKADLNFLYLQTILGFASDRFLETENPHHRVLSIT